MRRRRCDGWPGVVRLPGGGGAVTGGPGVVRLGGKMPKRRREETDPAAGQPQAEPAPPAEGGAMFVDTPDKLSTEDGQQSSLKISSWNVDGLRAWVKKKGLEWVCRESPDVLCLQETKCSEKQVPAAMRELADYPHQYWASSRTKEGYSGVAVLCRAKPLNVTYGIGVEEHDEEGRLITVELDKCFVVGVYVPNSGRGLVRLEYRQAWDRALLRYLEGLHARKPLVLCGDLNVAHSEIDLKNAKTNRKSAGFTPQERQGLDQLLGLGLVDTFRHLHPGLPHAYTFWTYMGNCRAKNVGWRLDYLLLSRTLLPQLCDSKIRSKIMGSDHCPIILLLAL